MNNDLTVFLHNLVVLLNAEPWHRDISPQRLAYLIGEAYNAADDITSFGE